LTPAQRAVHLVGDEEFNRTFGPEDGLGPLFVAPSCGTCHPGDGKGHPVFNLARFGRMGADGFDPMPAHGGPQLQHRAVPGYAPEQIPDGATGVARFTAPAVTGLGFLEAVDDATLLALADPDDRDGDGISGRVQRIDSTDFIAEIVSLEALLAGDASGRTRFLPVEGKFIGRFGKKGLAINLLHQTVQAYIQDMGLTTDLVPQDLFNAQVGNFATDPVPDPEVGSGIVEAVVFYLKTLRAPERRNVDDPAVQAGERLFEAIRCAACHVPTLQTGASEIAALDRVTFHPYTDLLLHDMGPELDDGYTEGIALTSEWRTPPLWGLGLVETFQGGEAFYLHDGRARSLREAIRLHGGEGAASRAAFEALSAEEQEQLLAFLRSL
ncbi:MAG: di-heme oxidoredictase family protein, partial [Rhodothermales bacterium]|nr:di-heme oxidoredictase family protein [Rhodothermales bacterium]